MCKAHYESLEVKKTVDELQLDSGRTRTAKRLSSKTVNKVEKAKSESDKTTKSALQEILQSVSNAKAVSPAPTISFAALSLTRDLPTPGGVRVSENL
eukprot:COSAG01_NODE_19645_length_998_cov_1.952169_1_plen_97_part_00